MEGVGNGVTGDSSVGLFKQKGVPPCGTGVGQWGTLRDHAGRKGVKGLLLVGHEEVPCGFGLRTGDSETQLMVLGATGDLSV